MPREKNRQTNFRLSPKALSLLASAARRSGFTKTKVVEICLVKYAQTIPGMVEEAHQFVLNFLAREFGQNNRQK